MNLTEKTVRKNYIYRGKIINLRCDDAELPDGRPCKREMVEHPGGSSILCVRDGKILLERQYRYAYAKVIWEIPAGKIDPGEDSAAAAVRELKEEAGLIAKEVRHLYTLYPTPGYTNELLYVYEATETAEGEQVLDDGEFLNLVWMPIEEAAGKVRTGEISDAKTVVAILTWLLDHKLNHKAE